MTARRIVAVGVLVISWGLALSSIAIAWLFQLPELPVPGVFLSASPPLVQSRFDEIGVTVAIIYGALSAVLLDRRPNPIGVVFAVYAVGSGIAAFGVQWGLLGERIPDLPLWGLLAHAAGWGYIPGTVTTAIVPLLVLRRTRGRIAKAVVGLGLGLALVATVAAILNQAPTDPATGGPVNPLGIADPSAQSVLPYVYGMCVSLAVAVSAGVAVWVVREWRRAVRIRRGRIAWLAVGHSFLTFSYLLLVIPAGEAVPEVVWDLGMIAPVIGQIFYPSAVLVLVLGTRMRGIDVAVSRVLLWSILVVVAVTAYLVVGELLKTAAGLDPVASGILAAALVSFSLQWARRGIARGIDRLIYGPDGDPAKLLGRLGERVGEFDSGVEGLTGSPRRSVPRSGSPRSRSRPTTPPRPRSSSAPRWARSRRSSCARRGRASARSGSPRVPASVSRARPCASSRASRASPRRRCASPSRARASATRATPSSRPARRSGGCCAASSMTASAPPSRASASASRPSTTSG